MVLWRSADAAKATGGRVTKPWAATGVSIDTRTLRAGELFVALKDVRDGHDFVAAALEKGAAAALVSRIPEGVAEDAPLLVVPEGRRGAEDPAVIFLAVLCGWVAVLSLLTALVAIVAPAVARRIPRLVHAASFAWTWLALITTDRRRS